MVQQEVLEQLPNERLAIFSVWEPILRTDDAASARKATTLFQDPRVENFWVETQDVGELFQSAIDLETEPAWDVYLVYPRGTMWTDEAPPRPEYFMHQLGGRLPDESMFDGPVLARKLKDSLRR